MSRPVGERAGLYGAPADPAEQRAAFTGGDVPVAVYGLGKMGLPLAAVYADVTGNTTGVDIDESVVATVTDGDCHVKREPGLPALVERVVGEGALTATADATAAARDAAVHVLLVPTLLGDDRTPDLSALESAVRAVGRGLSRGDLVVVESTVPPRTTADRVVPALVETSGLAPDAFGAAACPERTVGGQALADIRGTHPKVVGGVDAESTRAAALVYGEITSNEVVETPDATTAEAVKVFEGIYRDVNIALANQLAWYADALDIDVNDAIRVANTQPFCDLHDPGPGVGGHCIPVYPYFLAGAFDVDAPLLETAREVNDRMPAFTAWMLREMLAAHGFSDTPRVLLAGLTYKANIAELRNAPAVDVARLLAERGATVLGADPLVDDWDGLPAERVALEAVESTPVDAVAVTTPHDEFDAVDWDAVGAPVLDCHRAVDADEVPVYTLGGRWPR